MHFEKRGKDCEDKDIFLIMKKLIQQAAWFGTPPQEKASKRVVPTNVFTWVFDTIAIPPIDKSRRVKVDGQALKQGARTVWKPSALCGKAEMNVEQCVDVSVLDALN